MSAVVATGWSLYLPGVRPGEALADVFGAPDGEWAYRDSPPPDKAALVLGRKGLLYKEPSTRLALCAVHRALGLESGQRPDWPVQPRTAVVAASNLGNVETVAAVTRAIAAEGGHAVSVLDAPNVSSNVVASTVALWFAFGGPNLMVCSGTTAGLDGLRLARLLLLAGRADRVVLVGAEPADDVACALHATGAAAGLRAGAAPYPLLGGAACLILERVGVPTLVSRSVGVPAINGTEGAARVPIESVPAGATAADAVLVEAVPARAPWPAPPGVTVGADGFDPSVHWGDGYGAQGVVSLALAAHLAADEGYGVVGVRCDGEDGSRAALVRSVR